MFSYTSLLALTPFLPLISALPTQPLPLEKRCQKSIFPTIIQAINESSPDTNYPNTFNTNGQTAIYQNLTDDALADRLYQIIGFQSIPSTATNCVLNAVFPPSYPIDAINGHSPPLDIFSLGTNGQLAKSLSDQQASITNNNYPFNWNTPSLFNNPSPSLLGTTTLQPGAQSVINRTPFDCSSGLGGNSQSQGQSLGQRQGQRGIEARRSAKKKRQAGNLPNSTGIELNGTRERSSMMAFLIQISKEVKQEAGVKYNWQTSMTGLTGSQNGAMPNANGNSEVRGNGQSQDLEGQNPTQSQKQINFPSTAQTQQDPSNQNNTDELITSLISSNHQSAPSQSQGEANGGVGSTPTGFDSTSKQERRFANLSDDLQTPGNGALSGSTTGTNVLGAGQLGTLIASLLGTAGETQRQDTPTQYPGEESSGVDTTLPRYSLRNKQKRQLSNLASGFNRSGNSALSGAETGENISGTGESGTGLFDANELSAGQPGQFGGGRLGSGELGQLGVGEGSLSSSLSSADLPETGQLGFPELEGDNNPNLGSSLSSLNTAGYNPSKAKKRQTPNIPSGFNFPSSPAPSANTGTTTLGAGQVGAGVGGSTASPISGSSFPGAGASAFGGGSNANYGALIQALNASGIPADSNGRGGLRPGSLPANIEEMIRGGMGGFPASGLSGANSGGSLTAAPGFGASSGFPTGLTGAGTAGGLSVPTTGAGVARYKREDGAEPNLSIDGDTDIPSALGANPSSSGSNTGSLGGPTAGSVGSGSGGESGDGIGNRQNLAGFFLTYDC